ncbi:MAG: FG-GAP repeat protein [Proteobacteria bacterium]|nr:FG-GAP repeat protein [Pseudomonadota bacterium]
MANATWNDIAAYKLEDPDPQQNGGFGRCVASYGDTVVVGAPFKNIGPDDHVGGAYIFHRHDREWKVAQILSPSVPRSRDRFGRSVAIQGDTIAVGAPRFDPFSRDNIGAAYIFRRDRDGWREEQRVDASTPQEQAFFGTKVAVWGDTVLVAAAFEDCAEKRHAGAVYVFERRGDTWVESQKLQPSGLQTRSIFGLSLALDDGVAIIGAPGSEVEGIPDAGVSYLFRRIDGRWVETQTLVASEPLIGSRFGNSVGISGDTVIVAAHRAGWGTVRRPGGAYLFTPDGERWREKRRLQASDSQALGDFGSSIAIHDQTVAIGAQYMKAGTVQAGSAYVGRLDGGLWSEEQKFCDASASTPGHFGSSVSLYKNRLVVGAPRMDCNGTLATGACYVFEADGPIGGASACDHAF